MNSTAVAPKGIGGWLLLFLIGQIVALFLNLQGAADLSGFGGEAWELAAKIPLLRAFVVLEEICSILLCVGGVMGIVFILKRKPETPQFYVGFLAFVAGFGLLELGGVALLYPRLAAFVQAAGGEVDSILQEQSSLQIADLRQIAYGLVWLLYWRQSRRVTNTFERVESAP